MNSNYGRLIQQLQQLVNDQQVKTYLDPSIKMRADRILKQKEKKEIQQLIDELSGPNHSNLFDTQHENALQPFQPIFIKQKSISPIQKSSFNIHNSHQFSSNTNDAQRLNYMTKKQPNSQKISSFSQRKLKQSKSKEKGLKEMNNFSSNINCIKIKEKSLQRGSTSKKHSLNPKIKGLGQSSTIITNPRSKERLVDYDKQKRSNKQNQLGSLIPEVDNQAASKGNELDLQYSCFRFSKNKPSIKMSKGREVLEKLATLESTSSRFSRRKRSASASKQKIKINDSLNYHRQQTKQSSEEIIIKVLHLFTKLKEKILAERIKLKAINHSIGSMQHQITEIETKHREKQIQINISRKKSYSFFADAKKIEYKIQNTNKNNDIITNAITEQQYLIMMYNKVIPEIKSQIKDQQQQINMLQQHLIKAKDRQTMLRNKFSETVSLSDSLFDSMRSILRKQSQTKI